MKIKHPYGNAFRLGIPLLKRTYWIDYHDVFGTQTYYKCGVVNKVITSVEEVSEQMVIDDGATTHKIGTAPVVGSSCNTTDNYYYYVINTSTLSSLEVPGGFTLDLNGSTIATTQFTDLFTGLIFRLNNDDTHIINGNIKSSYEGFDFDTTKRRTGVYVAAEGVAAFAIGAAYCSLENLDVSYTLGYELTGGFNIGTIIGLNLANNGTENTRINIANGQQVASTGMISSDFIELPDNAENIGFGRGGYGNYDMGTRKEVFFSFYNSSKVYISSVKAKMYTVVKVPANAKYLRFTGYGWTKAEWPAGTDRGWLIFSANVTMTKNVLIKGCTWHDTRTTAFTLSAGTGITISNCHWYNIALEAGEHQVTRILGDLEDLSYYCNRYTIRNCLCEPNDWYGSNYLTMSYCKHLDFINNQGIFLSSGGIEDGFVEGNRMTRYDLYRRDNNPTPHVIYDDNVIGELSIGYQGDSTIHLEDEVEEVIAMSNTTIVKRCDYKDLRLINSENGGKQIAR